jgi:hypothetical protein
VTEAVEHLDADSEIQSPALNTKPNNIGPLAGMDKGHDLTAFSRTISASSLRGRLTKLTGAPLRPVAALHASIECVSDSLFMSPADCIMVFHDFNCASCAIQLCANQDTAEEKTADDGRCRVVGVVSDVLLCVPNALVCAVILKYTV